MLISRRRRDQNGEIGGKDVFRCSFKKNAYKEGCVSLEMTHYAIIIYAVSSPPTKNFQIPKLVIFGNYWAEYTTQQKHATQWHKKK